MQNCLPSKRFDEAWAAAEHLALLDPGSKVAAVGFSKAGIALGRVKEGSTRSLKMLRVRRGAGKRGDLTAPLRRLFSRRTNAPKQSALMSKHVTTAGMSPDQARQLEAAKSAYLR